MILIITNKEDFTADYVIYKMRKDNISYMRFNTEDFPYHASIIWDINNNSKNKVILKNKKECSLNDITGIWYRRPKSPEFSLGVDDNIKEFVTDEVKNMFSGIWRSINTIWVSHPDSIRNCSSKIDQMNLANKLGLSIPDTIITNNVYEAKEFINKYDDVLVKPLYKNHFSTNSGEKILYSNILSKTNYGNLDLIQNCPLIIQKYINKKLDIRINIFGKNIFATEIHSQINNSSKIKYDWRRSADVEIPHCEHILPDEIIDLCFKVVEHYKLNFGAFDFILTPNGEYVFLEINPNGQWAWIEDLTKQPLSNALISTLLGDE